MKTQELKKSDASGDPRAPDKPSAIAADAKQIEPRVVGVGASAGGLEALSELLRHVPPDHMAFIVVQHLSPDHPSLLPQLLSRESPLMVVRAEDGATIERNHVYVLPPGAFITVEGNKIRLSALPDEVPRHPVDALFRSLAAVYGDRAIGVVLSGTGNDGTDGLRAIHERGGLTFAQTPDSARYDGMPRSAMACGAVNFSLDPQKIGQELLRVVSAEGTPPSGERSSLQGPGPGRARLYALINSEFAVDLNDYKEATLQRRIERRMVIQKCQNLEDYVALARADSGELAALYQDLLITVTNFFRDPEAFEILRHQVLPKIIKRHQETEAGPIRLWSVGCATGEEAYSLAMCVMEAAEDAGWDAGMQVFATDLSAESVEIARRGIYAANIAAHISTDRLKRFFVRRRGEYRICRQVRDLVIFSKHNLLNDAPFSRIDLVTCRNLLIYLQGPAQKRAIRVLHYALRPGGCLMLGASETVGDVPEVFACATANTRFIKSAKVRMLSGRGGRAPSLRVASSKRCGRGHTLGAPRCSVRPSVNCSTFLRRLVSSSIVT